MARGYRRALMLGLLLAATGCADVERAELERFVARSGADPASAPEPLPTMAPPPAIDYQGTGLRDPFAVGGGATPARDPDTPAGPLARYALDALAMVGSIERRGRVEALVRAPDGTVHRVRPGNVLGQNNGRVVRVTDARIELEERIPDGFGGWLERPAVLRLEGAARE